MIRPAVAQLVEFGTMPGEDADEEAIERWANALKAIQAPVSDVEAAALAKCFPPDLGYGVGFSLLHLIETAPGWRDELAATISDEEWRDRARNRLANANRRS